MTGAGPTLDWMDPEPADLPMITPAQVERLADAAFLTNAQGTIAAWNTEMCIRDRYRDGNASHAVGRS